MSDADRKRAAKQFAEYWKGKGYEKGESQPFWLALLRDVYEIKQPEHLISFEDRVRLDHTSFIDGMIPSTHVLIEQKSLDKELTTPIRQSGGASFTPFQQAKNYSKDLPYSSRPRWIVTCNFKEFYIYDMEEPNGEPQVIRLADLPNEYHRMDFLVNPENTHIEQETAVSYEAGELVAKVYDAILHQYRNPESKESQRSLNILCVRIVFCLFAEDAGIFNKNQFYDYLHSYKSENVREALIKLFKVLDTQYDGRDPYEKEILAAFPYVNGGLFSEENIEIPTFTDDIINIILEECSAGFNWSNISPTIFGAVFESTLNPETRRSGGMHYTSIENIHKVIDPLFLDDLKEEFYSIKNMPVSNTRDKHSQERIAKKFQEKISKLIFLDPACGSGNFLTETFLSLRRLENKVLEIIYHGQTFLGEMAVDSYNPIKVSIAQFYGIEINDFAVNVAKTALWIAEYQMIEETAAIINHDLDFLPLKSYTNIHEADALSVNWNDIVPLKYLNYIMGNPPFAGARLMSSEQKASVLRIFDGIPNAGNIDFVACWHRKAAFYIHSNGHIRCAFVSTNSICQGEQVVILWQDLLERLGIEIAFAYRTFKWENEARDSAAVHCVIVGFCNRMIPYKHKYIYDNSKVYLAENINGYLTNAPNIWITSRTHPICAVPEIGIGNKPIDDGNYLFSREEMESFIIKEPKSKKWFKEWYGSREFINRIPRYCLWLGDCTPDELRQMSECLKRVNAVKQFRLNSKSAGTVQLAEKPAHFHVENMPNTDYILIPRVSSERRKYIPIGFVAPSVLSSDSVHIVPGGTLYHFGILTSNVHNAWMRAVAGRLKSDYRYSKDIVYNNFPWPKVTPEIRAKIEHTAQAILEAREKYPNATLADLYDPDTVTQAPELVKAHQANDKAVWEAYGRNWDITSESDCVAYLMSLYQRLIEQEGILSTDRTLVYTEPVEMAKVAEDKKI